MVPKKVDKVVKKGGQIGEKGGQSGQNTWTQNTVHRLTAKSVVFYYGLLDFPFSVGAVPPFIKNPGYVADT